jgi:hypothetical protein
MAGSFLDDLGETMRRGRQDDRRDGTRRAFGN